MVLFIFLLLFLVFICVFVFYSKKCTSIYDINMIVGAIGSGKTSISCKILADGIKKGFNCYADFETNIPGVRLYNPKDLSVFRPEPHSIVMIDEGSLSFYKRDFKEFGKFTEFFALCRHFKCKVYLCSQSFDVDLYIRDRTIAIYFVKRFGCISVMRRISKIMDIQDARSGKYDYKPENSGFIEGYEYTSIFSPGGLKLFWLPKLWKYHDSFYIPEREYLPFKVPVPLDSEACMPSRKEEVVDIEQSGL